MILDEEFLRGETLEHAVWHAESVSGDQTSVSQTGNHSCELGFDISFLVNPKPTFSRYAAHGRSFMDSPRIPDFPATLIISHQTEFDKFIAQGPRTLHCCPTMEPS